MKTAGDPLPKLTATPRTLRERLFAALTGRRSPRVLVLVNTTHGQRAVPVELRDLERRPG